MIDHREIVEHIADQALHDPQYAIAWALAQVASELRAFRLDMVGSIHSGPGILELMNTSASQMASGMDAAASALGSIANAIEEHE